MCRLIKFAHQFLFISMINSLSKNFEPGQVEDKWYRHWLEKKYFNSQPDNRPPFTVVIPPPNVTGVLHMGHTIKSGIAGSEF